MYVDHSKNVKTSLKINLLQPLFDMVQHFHFDSRHNGWFFRIIFKNENHIEIFQMKLNAFEMNQFHFFQRNDKRRLRDETIRKNP